MGNWKCPLAKTTKYFEKRLICQKEIKDGVNYADPKNFGIAMCLYQKHCNCNNSYQNTEQAKKCFELKNNK